MEERNAQGSILVDPHIGALRRVRTNGWVGPRQGGGGISMKTRRIELEGGNERDGKETETCKAN